MCKTFERLLNWVGKLWITCGRWGELSVFGLFDLSPSKTEFYGV
jgi:hypothetical protein